MVSSCNFLQEHLVLIPVEVKVIELRIAQGTSQIKMKMLIAHYLGAVWSISFICGYEFS